MPGVRWFAPLLSLARLYRLIRKLPINGVHAFRKRLYADENGEKSPQNDFVHDFVE
ncbi:MAG: hypothetical protein PHX50_02975 [Massilibacteroides sp.]|nr:hypothetical protein [Massilibacteroides sp.]MDD3061782.1 hypothetical protein [Massilibacteroides sp.]MDD4660426.1 hypothetical protein [Massilibacteroides sp.]